MDAVRALVRRKVTGLKLLGVPVLGLSADLLIGAGCVREVHSSAVSLGVIVVTLLVSTAASLAAERRDERKN